MKRRNLLFLFVIIFIALFLTACTTEAVTVSFYVDNVIYKQFKVDKGGYLDDIPDVPEKPGYKGVWSVNDFDEIVSDLRVDALYTVGSYMITFKADGATVYSEKVAAGKSVASVPTVPTKEGYQGKWNVSEDALSAVNSDIVIEAVYTVLPVQVTFYRNEYVFSPSVVRAGNAVPPYTYYVYEGDGYVLTNDEVFAQGKEYFTRAWKEFTSISATGGVLDHAIPTPPAEEGYSVKWMRVDETPTGIHYSTPDFSSVTKSFSVVAYPYITLSLVDDFCDKTSTVACDKGEALSFLRTLTTSIAGYEFFGWYYDENFRNEVVFPISPEKNVTLYAKWISVKATEGVLISDGVVVGYEGSEKDVYIPVRYEHTLSSGETATDYVTAIGARAFKGKAITSVSLPVTVKSIGLQAFYGCTDLGKVVFPDGNYIASYDVQAFSGCTSLVSFDFSADTESIGRSAFSGCSSLKTASGLGQSKLAVVERYAFASCPVLGQIELPDVLRSIGERAFAGDEELTVSFGREDGIESIGNFAFAGCKKFVGVTSAALGSLGESVFDGCTSLQYATLCGVMKLPELFGTTVHAGEESKFYAVTIGTKTYYLPITLHTVLIASLGSDKVVKDVLYDCYSVKNVSFVGNISTIEEGAFRLEHYEPDGRPFSVVLPDALKTIEKRAFETRTDMRAVDLPSSLESIGEYAFYNIAALAEVRLPAKNSLVSVGKYAFGETTWFDEYRGLISLGKIVLGISEDYCMEETISELAESDFAVFSTVAPYAFSGNTVLRKIALSSSVSKIGDRAFSDCDALVFFSFSPLQQGVERTLGENILTGCENLRDLTLCEDIPLSAAFGTEIPSALITVRLAYAGKDSTVGKAFGTSLISTNVENLYIEEGFVAVEKEAFSDNAKLAYVRPGEDIVSIGEKAFFGCTALTSVDAADSRIESIADSAFANCASLVDFAFPDTVTVIGEKSFYGVSLSAFVMPDALEEIGREAFASSLLTAVNLKDGLKKIGDYAFAYTKLRAFGLPSSVVLSETVLPEGEEEPVTVACGKGMIVGDSDISMLTLAVPVSAAFLFDDGEIPSAMTGVTITGGEIADDAFAGVGGIKTVSLSEGVTKIGKNAFAGCDKIKEIVIPSTVEEIAENAFLGCASLVSCRFITNECRLKTVGDGVFKNCSSLRNVAFPATVSESGWKEIFYGCSSLLTANLPAKITSIGEGAYYGCVRLADAGLHDNIVSIGKEAFCGCALIEFDQVHFNKLLSIGDGAFVDCAKISAVRAENVTEIGKDVYVGCLSLTEVTTLGEDMSYYADGYVCGGITSVNIACCVETIQETYFDGCENLRTVVLYSTSEDFTLDILLGNVTNDAMVFIDKAQYNRLGEMGVSYEKVYGKPSFATFTFDFSDGKATVTGMGESDETVVYLPEKATDSSGKTYPVTAIGDNAFLGATFTYVVIPACVEEIGNAAFSKSALGGILFESGSLCRVIGNNAFKESALMSIAVPSSVEEIGSQAFSDCRALTSVTFYANSNLAIIGSNAFEKTSALTSLAFTGPLSSVGASAFSSSGLISVDFGDKAVFRAASDDLFSGTHLTSVNLPSTVEYVGKNAFYGFAGETICLPDGVKTIGSRAFYQATNLKTVVFSSVAEALASCDKSGAEKYAYLCENATVALTEIGDEAFRGDASLLWAFLPDSVKNVGQNAFYGCSCLQEIYIGVGVETLGKNAFYNATALKTVVYAAKDCAALPEQNGVFYAAGKEDGAAVVLTGTVRFVPDNLFYPSSDAQSAPYLTSILFGGMPVCESIGRNAFRSFRTTAYEKAAASVILPETVLHVGGGAFAGRTGMTVLCESVREGKRWEDGWKEDVGVSYGYNNTVSGDFGYVVREGKVYLTDYFGVGSDVSVPDTIGGKPVIATGITFEQSPARTIDLADSVTLPGSFYGCENLVGVRFGKDVTRLSDECFASCESLLYFVVPEKIEEIGKNAFSGCVNMKTVYIDSPSVLSVLSKNGEGKTLRTEAGGLLYNAESVYVNKDLMSGFLSGTLLASESSSDTRTYTAVGRQSGYDIYTTLYWRASGQTNFAYVYMLNDWFVGDSPEKIAKRYRMYADGYGAMKEFGRADYVDWADLREYVVEVTVGDDITSVGKYSFYGMTNLAKVYYNAIDCSDAAQNKYYFYGSGVNGFVAEIGSLVERLPAYLFCECENLSEIKWSAKAIEAVGASAFENCVGLTEIIVPDTVVSVGDRAFSGCTKVETLTVGTNVLSMGSNAFTNVGFDGLTFSLQTIDYNAVAANDLLGNLSVFTNTYLLRGEDKGVCLRIGRQVTTVPDYLFFGCDQITSVAFAREPMLKRIGKYAFSTCINLESVVLPASLTDIDRNAFVSCTDLATIGFENNNKISFIGEKAFYNTAYYEENANWTDGVLYLNGKAFLLEATAAVGAEYNIVSTAVLVAENAFESAISLAYLGTPSSLQYINDGAFISCTLLKTVYIAGKKIISLIERGNSVGSLCAYADTLYLLAAQVRDDTESIGKYVTDSYHLVETDAFARDEKYYIYTKLYWECGEEEGADKPYAYLINDQQNRDYYIMKLSGKGGMADYASAQDIPWRSYRAAVTSVTIGSDITGVGNYAFAYFASLADLTFASQQNLKTIGDSAFYACSALKELTLVRSLVSIGKSAFAECVDIEKIDYLALNCNDFEAGDNVFASVGNSTDSGTQVEIAIEVVRIPAYLFDCSSPNIASVKFLGLTGSRVESIGKYAFYGLVSMTELTLEGMYLTDIGEGAFAYCLGLTKVVVPTGVKKIGMAAFAICSNIDTLTFAAAECDDFDEWSHVFLMSGKNMKVYFTGDVTTVPSYLFKSANVTGVEFPVESRIERIGTHAFGYCSGLTSLVLPDTLVTIESGALYACSGLTSLTTPFVGGKTRQTAASEATLFGYVFGKYEGVTLKGMTVVEQSYSDAGKEKFYIPDALTKVTVTAYTNLYYGAFFGCAALRTVDIKVPSVFLIEKEETKETIPNGYLIGNKAFYGCTSLAEVTMTENLTEIGAQAFGGCAQLGQITVPKNIDTIGKQAFIDCTRLTKVNYEAKACNDFAEDNNVFENVGTLQSGVTIAIGKQVTKIPAYFAYCYFGKTEDKNRYPNLTDITCSSDVLTAIGISAFEGNEKLVRIALSDALTSIGVKAFEGTGYYRDGQKWSNGLLYLSGCVLAYNSAKASSTDQCRIADGTRLIADGAFAGELGLKNVILPSTLCYIGIRAFDGCGSLMSVSFDSEEKLATGSLVSIGMYAFRSCTILESFTVTGNVSYIGEDAFFSCLALATVTIYSKDVCSSIISQTSAGQLCNRASVINVFNAIGDDETGSYLRTNFDRSVSGAFKVYKIKSR